MRARVRLAGLAITLLVGVLFLFHIQVLEDFDSRVQDVLTRWVGAGQASGRVAIVGIDERSLAQYGRWPWPRDLIGELAGRIIDAGADTVVLDMMFPDADPRRASHAYGG